MIKVLIIDDSALVRAMLTKILSKDSDIEVIGTAPDVYIARDKIVLKKPDVLTLDIEMPKMDGVQFLKKLMPQYPVPTIMVSSHTQKGAQITLEALRYGAIDFVLKPDSKIGLSLEDMSDELISKVKTASKTDVSFWKKDESTIKKNINNSNKFYTGSVKKTTDKIIAIGASTGGTVALRKIITKLPVGLPGIVIVQHMPAGFTKMFAQQMNNDSKVEVKEAESGDNIINGRVLIAPGNYQMTVNRTGGHYMVKCKKGEKFNRHCPSVDVLFNSIAENVGSNAIGIMLTGMGQDGAQAMLKMHNNGCPTLAQNEESCVVYGMPKEANKLGAVDRLLHIDDMVTEIINIVNSKEWCKLHE